MARLASLHAYLHADKAFKSGHIHASAHDVFRLTPYEPCLKETVLCREGQMARLASLHAYLHADEAEPPKPPLASVKQEAVQPEHAQVSLVCSTLFSSSASSLWVCFALFEGR